MDAANEPQSGWSALGAKVGRNGGQQKRMNAAQATTTHFGRKIAKSKQHPDGQRQAKTRKHALLHDDGFEIFEAFAIVFQALGVHKELLNREMSAKWSREEK